MSDASDRTALYRIFGEADLLLYIGISKDFGKRWKDHTKSQPWWDEHRRLAVEWCDSRDEAETAEEVAIKAEKPKYNVVHSGKGTAPALRPPVSDEQSVARKITELRQGARMSQGELARRMFARDWPWYQQTVARVERCERHLRLGELADIAAIFGVPMPEFLTGFDAADAAEARNALERELRENIAAEILSGIKPLLSLAATEAPEEPAA